MSGGELKVNFGSLDTAAADVRASAAAIEGRIDQLNNELAPLRSDWTGTASTAYQTAKTQWENAMSDMHIQLGKIGQQVNTSNEEYRATERANESRFQGL